MTARAITPHELAAIWNDYIEFRRPSVSPSTYARDYAKITRRIALMTTANPEITDSQQMRQWLLCRYAKDTTRRTLTQFQAAARWAVFCDVLVLNPFEGLTRYLTTRRRSRTAWASFTLAERDAIVNAFDCQQPFYAPWVKFVFWTGCRLEEAAALRWGNVAANFTEILIIEAEPIDTGIRQETKNYRTTRFPCNARLQSLLSSIKPCPAPADSRVFRGVLGGRFDYKNFQNRYWRPLVEQLAADGEIAFYLAQKHMRHSFITEAVKRLDIKDVSYLCRVSEAVLMKHYVGRSREIEVPEF